MQEQVSLPEFLVHFANNTNSRVVKNTPPPENEKFARTRDFPESEKLARTWDFR